MDYIISDIDGTVACSKNIYPVELGGNSTSWSEFGSRVGEAIPIEKVICRINSIVRAKLIFLTARPGIVYNDTLNWLKRYFKDFSLYMKQGSCFDDLDSLYKVEALRKLNIPISNSIVFEDSNSHIQSLRSVGYNVVDVKRN